MYRLWFIMTALFIAVADIISVLYECTKDLVYLTVSPCFVTEPQTCVGGPLYNSLTVSFSGVFPSDCNSLPNSKKLAMNKRKMLFSPTLFAVT